MAILIVSLANFFIGSFIGPADIEERALGYYGFDGMRCLVSNLH